MEINTQELYDSVFKGYPDVLDVAQVSKILGISKNLVYRILHDGSLLSLKTGRAFRIPKISLMKYVKIFDSLMCKQPTA